MRILTVGLAALGLVACGSGGSYSDDDGNFYHLEPVMGLSLGNGQLVTGVDVEIETPNGRRNMPGLVTNGSCNSCHVNGGTAHITAN